MFLFCRLSSNGILLNSLLLRVRGQPVGEVGLRDAGGHAVRDKVRRHGADGVLSGRSGPEETRSGRLRSVDGRGGDLFHLGLGDGTIASADLGRQDLLESGVHGHLFNALEVLYNP